MTHDSDCTWIRTSVPGFVRRCKFNEFVGEHSAGINGQQRLRLTAERHVTGFDRVPRSLHPRSISLLVTADLRIFKSCGARRIARIIHPRKRNQARPGRVFRVRYERRLPRMRGGDPLIRGFPRRARSRPKSREDRSAEETKTGGS